MDSVPVWVLTAVIEVSGLCIATLGLLTFVLWRQQRRLRATLRQLRGSQPLPSSPAVTLPDAPVPAPPEALPSVPDVAPTATAAEATFPPAATGEEAAQQVAAVTEPEPEAAPAEPVAEPEPTPEPVAVVEAATAPAAMPAIPPDEPAEATPASGVLTQDMLDALLAEALQEAPEEAAAVEDEAHHEAQQSVATLMAENVVMEQQLNELQEKNLLLRQSVTLLLANAALPLAEQQDLPVPEKTMQEMERGLAALQQTRERMQQQLQAHCQLLGFDVIDSSTAETTMTLPDQAGTGEAASAAPTAEDLRQLQAVLEQRTTEYQRIQEEYEQLLNEYQRVFENTAPEDAAAADQQRSQAA
ncbi:MAG: hypothetical protein AB7N91_05120 [Candidatus Tectimicrobiota bacterium]